MEDFVTFEIAKKLKEKGFKESCFGWYYPSEVCGFDYKTIIVFNNSAYRGSNYKDMLVSHKDEKYVDAPTIAQVLKWLREEKELHIEIYMYHNCYLFEIYNTIIYDADFTQKSEKYSEIEYENYEQAAIAGIEYVLDNLI